jgi:hypothetical protein
MSIKIQINSLQALERLIGGDSEIEVEIRGNIVHEFSKKHLKSIVATDAMKDAANHVVDEIRNELKTFMLTEVKKSGSFWSTVVIKPELRKELLETAKYGLMEELRQEIKSNLKIDELRESIQTQAEKAAKYIAEELTNESLEEQIDLKVKQKLKEMLG